MKKWMTVIGITVLIAWSFSSIIGGAALKEEREIYDKTLRLHIPACSDSEADQAVKLMVRDAVIAVLRAPLSKCETKAESIAVVQNMSETITKTANNVLKDNGFNYEASVTLVEEYYPRKSYEGFTLPAGTYTSLKIELGEAKGKNWWCVLFPQVCVGTARAEETLAEVGFTPKQIRLLTEQEEGEYVVKFKIVEILESIFG
jgi:stage II sporulation protein R